VSDVVHAEAHDGALIVTLNGRLDSNNARAVEEELMRRVEGHDAVVLDFHALDYISSAGLRIILLLGKRMRARRGRLVLCRLPAPIRDVFEISGFLSIFSIFKDREAATAAVGQPAQG